MKDNLNKYNKLKKYNHKAGYYKMKKTFTTFGFVFGFLVAGAIPLSIMLSVDVAPKAEETQEKITSAEENSVEISIEENE